MCLLLITITCTHQRVSEKRILVTVDKPVHHFRKGMWVRAASTASPDSISRIIEIAREFGVTDIFVQVVVGGYAYYNSQLLPRSQYLSKVSETGYDPLDSLIRACSNTPIRIHAWVNALLYWSLSEPPDSLNHALYKNPDWFIRDVNHQSMADYSYTQWKNMNLEGLYLNPENPEVAMFIRQICAEIVSQYHVDGIHLDFIRYPGILWGLPPIDEAAVLAGIDAGATLWCNLVRYGRSEFYNRWKLWNAWRLTLGRQYAIARIVYGISEALKENAVKKDCRLSTAVFANPSLCRYSFAQDWTHWAEEIYQPVVMSYTPDIALFNDYAVHALSYRPDALLGIGLLWPDMIRVAKWQEEKVRTLKGAGVCYFDFAIIDTMAELLVTEGGEAHGNEEIFKADSTRYLPVADAYEDLFHPEQIGEATDPATWGHAIDFAAFLLSLSMNADLDLGRMDLMRDEFLQRTYQDVAAFEYLNEKVFPVGDLLIEPEARAIKYSFIPWSEGDSLSVIAKASEIRDLDIDTIVYPSAIDPLIDAAFAALPHRQQTLPLPSGVYVFIVDTVYQGGRQVLRKDVAAGLRTTYVNWTIKTNVERILGNMH